LNKTGPDLVQHFRPLRVDGNLVYLGTDNGLFFERLQHPAKVELVERSLSHVHKMPLRVKIEMTSGGNYDEAGTPLIDPDDPLLAHGLELGAEIKPMDKKDGESED
jgi:hypothetical protein